MRVLLRPYLGSLKMRQGCECINHVRYTKSQIPVQISIPQCNHDYCGGKFSTLLLEHSVSTFSERLSRSVLAILQSQLLVFVIFVCRTPRGFLRWTRNQPPGKCAHRTILIAGLILWCCASTKTTQLLHHCLETQSITMTIQIKRQEVIWENWS